MPPRTILVVEDDLEVRESLVETLEDEGHRVFWAADGLEALEQLRREEGIELILLDLMMPRMNGREFRAVQLREPRWGHIPVVVLTAHARLEETAAELQAAAYLRKPVKLEKLLEVVEGVCSRPGANGSD